ncbi:MAG: Ribonuclease VapC, partial [Rhizobacter sp.]|nr:Ribonuclease VapC [Rhizobacter sp.]
MHPYVLGEIACGSIGNRQSILGLLDSLPTSVVASRSEVLDFIE